jgi:predicted esterase
MAPATPRGKPRIFIAHGKNDAVLPIDRCSRRIVPQLQASGYEWCYQEFNDHHKIPHEIAEMSIKWFLQGTKFT